MNDSEFDKLENKIYDKYIQLTPKSKQIYLEACRSFAGGVSGQLRLFEPHPLYMTHGRGSKTYDVDGSEYVDCFLCSGALLLGHCHSDVMETVRNELERGLLISNPDLGVRCADLLKKLIPCAERVRFVNTGTEAAMFAVRIARAFTGKNKIIKFFGHYHGQEDQFLLGTSSNKNDIVSFGVPQKSVMNTVLLPFNNLEALRQKLNQDNDIAGVILDPQMTMGGLFPASNDYLRDLRKLTDELGVVLIFDEVITGFRLALGGAQEYFGVIPDLAIFSKSIAAGAKLAAVTGKEEIMSVLIDKKRRVFQSGTYNDGTVGLAAGLAAMKVYSELNEKDGYAKIHKLASLLKAGIEDAFQRIDLSVRVNQFGPCIKILFTELESTFDTYCNLDKRFHRLFLLSLINEGVILSLPSSGSIFLSFAHDEKDVEQIIGAINKSIQRNRFDAIEL